MIEEEKTSRVPVRRAETGSADGLCVTVFAGLNPPVTYELRQFGKTEVTFGRAADNDIVLPSQVVSGSHGRFRFHDNHWDIEDRGCYGSKPSLNGLIFNDAAILRRTLSEGDFIRIDDGVETLPEGVLFVCSARHSANQWDTLELDGRNEYTVGRARSCDIVLPHISVSKVHARIVQENGAWYIVDNNSTNGILVNDRRLVGRRELHEKDVIVITNSKLIFTSAGISYCCYRNGISVDTAGVYIRRGKGRKAQITGNNISVDIRPGELVAIIGGSGAGKSTILNCMCGYLKPWKGSVYINGVDLYRNFDSMKKLIGYVPQSDIVYDNLTLHDMLSYTAKLRLPRDTGREEREKAINRAISLVELQEKKESYIKRLSGGQRKRASIAVELLSDPNLLFLDEPASGLDPGTERNLMASLRTMANSGKTVILVTHSTLQLQMCDKILFMGKGGNLCFCGSYQEALSFFGVDDIVDVYNLINEEAPVWRDKYDAIRSYDGKKRAAAADETAKKVKHRFQLPVLCSRYLKLVFNDRQRLILLLIQAPALALLISLVADGEQFNQYEMTKSLLFALSCSAFWVGMLNAIQEICKEQSIMKREYMTGLSLTAYLFSKILVLGLLCMIQSVCIVAVFKAAVGMPEEGLFTSPFLELLITTFLTALASAAMGLFVSSLFTNADRAMTVAPILLMPQILFSGLIFKLDGITETISWFAVCRWSMEGYGTTANLNSLQMKAQQQGLPVTHDPEDFFDFTVHHMLTAWGILFAFVVVFLVVSRILLARSAKKSG